MTMQTPRFSEDLVSNNLALAAVATGLFLLTLLLLLFATTWVARLLSRAIGSERLEGYAALFARSLRRFGVAVSLLVVVAACSTLAFSFYFKFELQRWVVFGARYLTGEVGARLLRALALIVGVSALLLCLRSALRPVFRRVDAALARTESLAGQPGAVTKLVDQLALLTNAALLYAAFELSAPWLDLPSSLHWLLATIFYTLLVLRAARAAVLVVALATGALDRLGLVRIGQSRFVTYYQGVRGLWPLARSTFEAITYLAAATLIVQRFEALEAFAPYGPRIIRLVAIFFVARVVVELSQVLVQESLTRTDKPVDDAAKRRMTLVHLVQSVVKYAIYLFAAVSMMQQIGIDPTPILAGAGIIGLAVGLGAQKLVNDMVSGFFLLFEGQLLTGDYVKIGEAEGVVEAVQLRITMIRDIHGQLHTLRNGDIGTIINSSRGYVCAVVDLPVRFESDIGKVFDAVREAGKRLRAAHPASVLEEPRIEGVNKFEGGDASIRTITKVVSGTHVEMALNFRRILWETFREFNLEVPSPGPPVVPPAGAAPSGGK